MRIVYVKPGETPELLDVDKELKKLQTLVNGYLECAAPFDDPVFLLCNEEGKYNGSKPNRYVLETQDVIMGPFFLCQSKHYDMADISDEMAEKYMERFRLPESFHKNGKDLVIKNKESTLLIQEYCEKNSWFNA